MKKRAIVINEICEEGAISLTLDYDLLPTNVKALVDKALKSDEEMGDIITCDIYQDGLQSFSSEWNAIMIAKNTEVLYLGSVDLYHE